MHHCKEHHATDMQPSICTKAQQHMLQVASSTLQTGQHQTCRQKRHMPEAQTPVCTSVQMHAMQTSCQAKRSVPEGQACRTLQQPNVQTYTKDSHWKEMLHNSVTPVEQVQLQSDVRKASAQCQRHIACNPSFEHRHSTTQPCHTHAARCKHADHIVSSRNLCFCARTKHVANTTHNSWKTH
jgi:hypothetical protein